MALGEEDRMLATKYEAAGAAKAIRFRRSSERSKGRYERSKGHRY